MNEEREIEERSCQCEDLKELPHPRLLLLGPTGVGKTEVTKALAISMFGSENDMIRFDMSEFMDIYVTTKCTLNTLWLRYKCTNYSFKPGYILTNEFLNIIITLL